MADAGRYFRLSLGQRLACDFLDKGAHIPWATVQRNMSLAGIVAVRNLACPRPGWCAIFTKAYAHVCAVFPELRRSRSSFPRTGLYEHSRVGALVAVERKICDEAVVLFQPIPNPDCYSLADLSAHIRHAQEQPVETIAPFRSQLQTSAWPAWVRRLAWWLRLDASARRSASNHGTFGVCSVAAQGAGATGLRTPLATNLNYGVIRKDGSVDVAITFDQRVVGAAIVARALERMESVLRNEIVIELRYLEDPASGAA